MFNFTGVDDKHLSVTLARKERIIHKSMEMDIKDYAAMQDLQHSRTEGWGSTTALWVIVAALIIIAIVYNWSKNCNEKVQFATGLANLSGQIQCLTPKVETLGAQMYGTAQTVAATVTGVASIKDCFGSQLYELNNSVFYHPRHGRKEECCGNGGNRVFNQKSTYNLASQQVEVDEYCRN